MVMRKTATREELDQALAKLRETARKALRQRGFTDAQIDEAIRTGKPLA